MSDETKPPPIDDAERQRAETLAEIFLLSALFLTIGLSLILGPAGFFLELGISGIFMATVGIIERAIDRVADACHQSLKEQQR